MNDFTDKTIVITGGGGGIGGATARRFAAQGGRVAVCDRDPEAAARVAQEITAAGGIARVYGCDITDRASVQRAMAAVETDLGPIAVLVNNAGWDVFKPFLQTSLEDWQRLIAINLVGALHMHHVVLPLMVARKAGRVVNIASDAARVGSSGEAVYAACKAGLVALSKTLAREHARDGITFNVVCPGPTQTALFEDYKKGAGNADKLAEAFRRSIPLGRIGEPEDLPGAITFFASDAAGYITGQVLSVSGGLSMVG
ncbi:MULTISPECIES: glucose 1-dehydrogenase [unclassified Xanthobacter]|uniref:glucose 1-dehydrogenase n=1 Tax=unclassified Xanthobacter TaxID=2623496 RepID=UPI001EDFBD65